MGSAMTSEAIPRWVHAEDNDFLLYRTMATRREIRWQCNIPGGRLPSTALT